MYPSSNYLFKFFVFLLPFLFVGSAAGFTCSERINVALAANGATASASSQFSTNYPVYSTINGDRRGRNWNNGGGWNDGTINTHPDWLQIDFNGTKTIDEINVITLQDNPATPAEPTELMTFTLYGLTGYSVQYWNGSAWVTVTGGTVSGNNKVWRKFTFTAITTTKIRVLTSSSPDAYSRITEVEAWGNGVPPSRTNFALGGLTSASSQFNANYPAFSTINGDRRGRNWNNGGGWNDATVNTHPDWLEINFNGSKTIDEITVITLQDNPATPAEPTEAMTFTLYGLTGYSVQYWNGSAWTTVPGGTVTGNNKVWKKFTFTAISTTKIRVLTSSSPDAYSRITEVEAWGPQSSSCQPIARLDPLNGTGGGGENPLSQNFNWNLPLVNLPGRAGLDLYLALSYNSLVWTKSGSTISFNDDNGFPGPGFRLGFPVIQQLHYNNGTGKYGYLLIGPDGSRTELRQVGTSVLFEAADSSHLLLDTTDLTLQTTNGTQLTYVLMDNQLNCTKIKDRNGNYITIDYVSGRVDKVIDTLGRQIKFNYDGAGLLTSITQTWKQGQPTETEHPWAEFTYTNTTIQAVFSGLTVSGLPNNTIKTLSKVTLPDDSHFDFSYTSWGQVWKVAYIASDNVNHVLHYRAYNLPGSPLQATGPQTDCPRFTERRDWIKYWNGDTEGAIASNEEAVTSFSGPVFDTWTMPGDSQSITGKRTDVTLPDGTVNKIYFVDASGSPKWSRGLAALTESSSGGNWQRKVKTTWTQDNTTVDYPLNPRVLETNIYDPSGNRARAQIDYQQFTLTNGTSCWLPRDFMEYAADASTVLRTTRTNYNTSASYTDRRILGLPSEKLLYSGTVSGTLMSRVEFFYDESGSIQGSDAPTQHNNPNYVVGRANLTRVKRYNVNNFAESTSTTMKYNTAGAVVSSNDASDHQVLISYADSYSDNNNSRGTFAYPKTITDADGYAVTSKYNFDFGAVTYQRTPKPNETNIGIANTDGPEQTFTYDTIGRLEQITNLVNNAYTRFVYVPSQLKVEKHSTIQDGVGESPSFRITDGAGRTIATATDHPGDEDRYSGQMFMYDVMGRITKTSNPTETSASGAPFQWNSAGDDATAGWIYSEQTYDWKGRPLATTNPSVTSNPAETTTVTASYTGCGCAGGEVITLTDEGTKVGSDTKKRQRKIYTDVLGRVVKTEVLNWDGSGPNGTGGTVYSTIATTYNARDQVTLIREFAGTTSSSNFKDTTMSYDGFGRLKTQHVPEQKVDPNNSASSDHTTWNYNSDDTVQSIVDARGVITNFSYNARHLVTGIAYDASNVPTGANVAATTSAAFTYDAAGNRKSMSDGSGAAIYHYDQLSRMDWEERTFSGLPTAGTFRLSYEYSLGGVLKSVTDERADTSFTETLDRTGRVTAVNAVGRQGAETEFASQIQYRAGGQLKSRLQGNTTLSLDYNNRGLVKSYSVTNYGNASYAYHPDGVIKLAQNGDPIKDRAYSYDAANRLQTAYSGVEARNFANNTSGGTPDGPYLHSYTYDHWNNETEVDSRFWTRGADVFLSFDANNRVSGWSYDAEGNVLSRNETGTFSPFEPGRFAFDAAGRQVGSTQKRSTFIIEEGTGYVLTNDFVNTQKHDGDGQVVDHSVLRHLYVNTNFSTTFGGRVFLLRSTVLGGKTISEYDATGTWSTTHVFAGGERIGQVVATGPPAGIWHNFDPVTRDLLSTLSNGNSWARTTLDPGGANVGDSDPFPADGSADPDGLVAESQGGKNSQGILGADGGRSDCVLDGIEVDCSFIRGETSVQCPDNDCGPRWNPDAKNKDGSRGAFEHFYAFVNGFAGYMTQYGHYKYGSGAAFFNHPFEEEKTSMLEQSVDQRAKKIPFVRLPLLNHKKLLQDTLAYSDCDQFMSQLISETAGLSEGKNDPVSTDIITLYGTVNRQARGGFRLNHEGDLYGYGFRGLEKLEQIAAGGGASWGNWGASNVTIWINEQKKAENASAREIARTPFEYAQRSLEELVHVAGKNRTYTESEINSAANALEPGLNFIQAIKKHCIPRQMW